MESQNMCDLQEDKPRRRRRGFLSSHKCAALAAAMVILLGTLCAYIVSVAFGTPVPAVPENPSEYGVPNYQFPFLTLEQWNARQPKRQPTQTDKLATPVPYVVIHHSFNRDPCYNDEQCGQAMRYVQNFHMDKRNWWQLSYNFCVGGNGKVYEGRGWQTLGEHSRNFNTVSIGICLIGSWYSSLPPVEQLETTQKLIEAGVALGFISPQYKLVGHRQVRNTVCPGDALFKEIQTWDNYSPFPHSVEDVVNVKELPASVRELLRNNTM